MSERQDKPHKIAELLRAIIGKTESKYYTSAVILAAGTSSRMGGDTTKQFCNVGGLPVVARTLIEFERSPLINEIILVAKSDLNEIKTGKAHFCRFYYAIHYTAFSVCGVFMKTV